MVQDDQVVVLGCGGVGMMGVQFAKALFGKGPIAADIDEGRLEAAKKAGASATYNTKDPASAKKLMADTGGGAYAVVDFVGSEATFAFANQIVRKGGRIIIVGLFGGAMGMPLPMFPMRALTIAGSFVGSLPEAQEMMELVRAGKVDPIPYSDAPARPGQPDAGRSAGRQDRGTRGADAVTIPVASSPRMRVTHLNEELGARAIATASSAPGDADRNVGTPREERMAEDILEPDLPIIDPHHHLWDRPTDILKNLPPSTHGFMEIIKRTPRYLFDELLADLQERPQHHRHRLYGMRRDVPRGRAGKSALASARPNSSTASRR